MKSILRGFLSLVLLVSTAGVLAGSCGASCSTSSCTTSSCCDTNNNANCCANVCPAPANCNNQYAMTFYRQYEQGQHMGQNSVGVVDKMHQYGRSEFYGLFDVNLIYEQTFRANKVSSYFAGANGLLTIGANQATLNGVVQNGVTTKQDIRASDLGLASNFSASGCFKPKIQNFIANLDLFLAWDEFICGLYTRLRVPLTWTRFNLNFGASTLAAGSTTYPNNFVVAGTGPAVAYTTAAGALLGNNTFGDAPTLNYGKVCCQQSKFSVSGIQLDVGYNWILTERSRVGLAVDVIFPSGYLGTNGGNSTCCPPCLFSPNIGAQQQWQVGGVLGARYELWNCDEQALLVYFEGMFNAVIGRNRARLLGLKSNGSAVAVPFNHYLLLKKYNSSGTYQCLERAANLLCQSVKLKTLANVDLMAAFEYRNCGFNFWLGYHFAYLGRECGSICNPTFGTAGTYYVIKADQNVSGTTNNGFYAKATADIASTNAAALDTNGTAVVADLQTAAFVAADVDATRALAPSLVLNGIFGYLGYDWCECDWAPFLGVGFNADFGRRNFPLSQWGVFLKGGVQF